MPPNSTHTGRGSPRFPIRRFPSTLNLGKSRILRLPAVMGVLNVTPDSFSDGGRYLDPSRAVEHALAMEEAGADIIDVGGESSRPIGAKSVSLETELGRVRPVLEKLAGRLRAALSVDTRKAAVARVALDSGATIINDISALTADPEMAEVAARAKCAVVLMHMRGGPDDHMKFASYRNVAHEVAAYLTKRARFAIAGGIARARIVIDPGVGFAKRREHNLALLRALPSLCALGYPVLWGASRKTFIRRIAGASEADLAFGSAAIDAIAIASGASIVRVHDPGAARAVVRMAGAFRGDRIR